MASAATLQEMEALVDELHRRAQELNKLGRTDEATAAYKEMAALDDRALELALSASVQPTAAACEQHAARYPDYSTLHRPFAWGSPGAANSSEAGMEPALVRGRAMGAVVGAVVADAAAMGVHWVYDVALLGTWEAELAGERAQSSAVQEEGSLGPVCTQPAICDFATSDLCLAATQHHAC
jgi:hypothetical protein